MLVHLHQIEDKTVTGFDHKELTKLQKKLTKFINSLMCRLDILSLRALQDFLNLDITGNLVLNTIDKVVLG